jgi:pimeloyl-ACP methyl ester carboxylesterase
MRKVYIGLGIILFVYLLGGVVLALGQQDLIYYPDGREFGKCPQLEDTEKIDANGTRAYFKDNSAISDTVVVFYHGNMGNACDRAYMKKLADQAGHSSLLVEYAGYSADPRQPTKELLLQDARNIASFVGEKGFGHVLLIGESLGGAVASHHAKLGKFDSLLLITPFDSLGAVAQKKFPIYPAGLLLKDDYDNIEPLQELESIWIVHGTEDPVIPKENAGRLFDSILSGNKKFIAVEGAGHGDILSFDQTQKALQDFLATF